MDWHEGGWCRRWVVSQFEKSAVSRDGNTEPTRTALQDVFVNVSDGTKRRSLFMLNPATGALEIPVNHHRVFEKALRSEVRCLYLRLKFRLLVMKLHQLRLGCLSLTLQTYRKLFRFLD